MAFGDLINRQTHQTGANAMHARTFLHKHLRNFCSTMHLLRTGALVDATLALLQGQTLTLTDIGRHIRGDVDDKHNIKRIDRLLGNATLVLERQAIYSGLTRLLIGNKQRPVILVDYSDVDAQRTRHILRAAIAVEGRAISLYEEVHEHENSPPLIEHFLLQLAEVLPSGCTPILVTDAGFRSTWRKVVSARGWYYVMRQRNRDLLRFSGDSHWLPCKSLYAQARNRPICHGEIDIARNRPTRTIAYTYKNEPKGRTKKAVHGVKVCNAHDRKVADQNREPWLLLSNLPVASTTAETVVRIYKKRMQIEEAFRDLKSHRFGFALRGNRTWAPSRVEILLLLAALASWLQWLLGVHARDVDAVRGMQANTVRKRNVLSLPSVGRIFFSRYEFPSATEMKAACQILRNMLVISP